MKNINQSSRDKDERVSSHASTARNSVSNDEALRFINTRGTLNATDHTNVLSKMTGPIQQQNEETEAYLKRIRVYFTLFRLVVWKKRSHVRTKNKEEEN